MFGLSSDPETASSSVLSSSVATITSPSSQSSYNPLMDEVTPSGAVVEDSGYHVMSPIGHNPSSSSLRRGATATNAHYQPAKEDEDDAYMAMSPVTNSNLGRGIRSGMDIPLVTSRANTSVGSSPHQQSSLASSMTSGGKVPRNLHRRNQSHDGDFADEDQDHHHD